MNYWLKTSLSHPLIIGHRGARAYYPENTIGAMRLAHKQGAHGIEFDVRLCKSGEVIVIHDLALDRTTNGTGNVSDLTLAEIRQYDAGQGERVPTLAEIFEAMRDASTDGIPFLFNVELKNNETQGDGLEAAVAAVVRQYDMGDRVVFSSFSANSIREILKHAPEVPRGFLYYGEKTLAALRNVDLSDMQLSFHHPHFALITPELMTELGAQHLGVNTWTVNERDDIRHMITLGVTGIIGDSPATIVEMLGPTLGEAPAPSGGGGWG